MRKFRLQPTKTITAVTSGIGIEIQGFFQSPTNYRGGEKGLENVEYVMLT
jgi:hypothetical protein